MEDVEDIKFLTTDGWKTWKREKIGWKWWMKRKEQRRNWIKLLDKKMDKMQQGRDKRWDETLDKGWMKWSKEGVKMDEMNERAQESAQEPWWLGNFIPGTPQLSLTYLLSGRWWVLCVWGGELCAFMAVGFVQLCAVLSVNLYWKIWPFPSMTRLLVGCIEILFLLLAATIFRLK
jgi:hypothetical protein